MCIPEGKDWVDVTTALLTPTIAIWGIVITWQQWVTSRDKLKYELFDKRYQIYEKIGVYVSNVLITGRIEPGKDNALLVETNSALFLFNEEIKTLVSDIYKKSIDLHALEAVLSNEAGEAKKQNIEKQREIKEWFFNTHSSLYSRFSPFLKLKH